MESHGSQAPHHIGLQSLEQWKHLLRHHHHHRHHHYYSFRTMTAAIYRTSTKGHWINDTVWLCHMHLPGPVYSTLHVSPHLNCLPRGEHLCYCHFAGKQGYAAWLRDRRLRFEARVFLSIDVSVLGYSNQWALKIVATLLPKRKLLNPAKYHSNLYITHLHSLNQMPLCWGWKLTLWSCRGIMSSFLWEYSLTGKRLSR